MADSNAPPGIVVSTGETLSGSNDDSIKPVEPNAGEVGTEVQRECLQTRTAPQKPPPDSAATSRSRAPEISEELTGEIIALKKQLLKLEGKARGLSLSNETLQYENESRLEQELKDGEANQQHPKRLSPGIKWVKKIEARAMDGTEAEERQSWGTDGSYDFDMNDYRYFYARTENSKSAKERAYFGQRDNVPLNGVRPSTSIRPVYSRKLGPPTQWDKSDSEEWDSDDSTRSRDFDYFRARLRGDFEWELDRLSAQKKRYAKHKEKKLASKAALKKKARPEMQSGEKQTEEPEVDLSIDKSPSSELQYLRWTAFEAARYRSTASSWAIDILVGEPEVWDARLEDLLSRRSRKAHLRADKASQDASAQLSAASLVRPDGLANLPERIRINSKQILKTLSMIHGSDIVSDLDNDSCSVVMLRPFRMLSHYATQIRDWQANLVKQLEQAGSDTNTAADRTDPKPLLPRADSLKTPANDGSGQGQEPQVQDPKGYSKSEVTVKHLDCLLTFLDQHITKKQAELNSPRCRKAFFADLWYLFKPGAFVISADGKQVYQITKVSAGQHVGSSRYLEFFSHHAAADSSDTDNDDESTDAVQTFAVHCTYVQFDGSTLGPVPITFRINKYDGEREITTLIVYPLRFHAISDPNTQAPDSKLSDAELSIAIEKRVSALRSRLVKRGQLYVDVAGVKHMYYAGTTLNTREEVESQVIIDFAEAFVVGHNKNWLPPITRLLGTAAVPETKHTVACEASCCSEDTVHDEAYVENKEHKDWINNLMAEIEEVPQKLPSVAIFPRSLEALKTQGNSLTDDELLIMSHRAPGFVLRDRTWALLDLDHLTEVSSTIEDVNHGNQDDTIQNDTTAFGRLVLPPRHKEMVLSLVAQHFRNKATQKGRDEQVDIVRGKGKGLIILLHGAPGVGKTTTAEGVAERFKKPLFQITCGDLGSNAKQVEEALQINFALASRWDCILLLDEADVFLAERRREDFSRNALVAVFLRVLEYYAGILFLTTNRIGDFDEAFASRIHMSLHYPALNEDSTAKIFKLNLDMIKARYKASGRQLSIDEFEIAKAVGDYWREHEHARWNGRQIRNACQTALALAEFDAQPEGSKYDLKADSSAPVHLKIGHLDIVSAAYLDFMHYLKEVHGADSNTHAKELRVRAREGAVVPLQHNRSPGGKNSFSNNESSQTDNPLRNFKLQGSAQHQSSTAAASMPEYMQPSVQYSRPQAEAQPGQYMQGQNLSAPSGGHQRYSIPAQAYGGPNSAPVYYGQPSPTPSQTQPYTYTSQPPSIPPQPAQYSSSTNPFSTIHYATGHGTPAVMSDANRQGGLQFDQHPQTHGREMYPTITDNAGHLGQDSGALPPGDSQQQMPGGGGGG